MEHIHVRVEGRVQGVFFRDFTRREAQARSLNGWVRNMPDGAVEAVFCGDEPNIESMVNWLHQGSPHSIVTSVIVKKYDAEENFNDFQIRY